MTMADDSILVFKPYSIMDSFKWLLQFCHLTWDSDINLWWEAKSETLFSLIATSGRDAAEATARNKAIESKINVIPS